MSTTHALTMGDRGRLVVPAEVRRLRGLDEGTPLVLLDTDDGILVLTREQARRRLRDQLAGQDLVGRLLEDRRATATEEDA